MAFRQRIWGERFCSKFLDKSNVVKFGKQAKVSGGKETSLLEDMSSSISDVNWQKDSLERELTLL